MGMLIDYQNDNNLSVFQLRGEKSFKEAIGVWERIFQTIQNDSPHAVLVFDNCISKLYCSDVLQIEAWLREVNFPKDHKIAIIDSDLTYNSMNKFGEDVAYNRGWFNIRVFKNEMKAREWLEESTT